MIAKIVKGAGAKGIVDYILDRKKGASLIDHDGVLVSDNGSIARSFIAQSRFNPKVGKFIGHISLSFSEQDLPHLTDELMVRISREYMMKMGIRDTQYIIGRHHDKEHPHVHIAFNRIDNNGRTISDRNDRYRSERVCKELTRKYGLYFAEGKEQVNTDRLFFLKRKWEGAVTGTRLSPICGNKGWKYASSTRGGQTESRAWCSVRTAIPSTARRLTVSSATPR